MLQNDSTQSLRSRSNDIRSMGIGSSVCIRCPLCAILGLTELAYGNETASSLRDRLRGSFYLTKEEWFSCPMSGSHPRE